MPWLIGSFFVSEYISVHYMGVFADPICHKIHQATADLLKNMSLLLGLNTIFKQLRKLKCCRSLSVLFWRFLIVFIMFLKCFPFFKVFFDDWRVFGDFYLIYSIERIRNRIRRSKILSPDPDPKLIRIHYTLKKGKRFGLWHPQVQLHLSPLIIPHPPAVLSTACAPPKTMP